MKHWNNLHQTLTEN